MKPKILIIGDHSGEIKSLILERLSIQYEVLTELPTGNDECIPEVVLSNIGQSVQLTITHRGPEPNEPIIISKEARKRGKKGKDKKDWQR